MQNRPKKIAVLLPCYNEAGAIEHVVSSFKKYLPEATIYVYDNNSTDNTAQLAEKAGAKVDYEFRQGKGYVVASMFKEIEADIYVLADGDGTYDACYARDMINHLLDKKLDMIVGNRMSSYSETLTRKGHSVGNRFISQSLKILFGSHLNDVLSGYRVMTRKFVKNCPLITTGFEIEVFMTIHALEIKAKVQEIEIDYKDRHEGTESKLNTYKDGLKIVLTIFRLFKDMKPIIFFSLFAIAFFLLGLFVGIPVIAEFIATSQVNKFPSAILAAGLMVLSAISLTAGVILDSIARGKTEIKRMLFQTVL
ncbi:MAG: glycosyltransferase [Pseudomonadota bacterium]